MRDHDETASEREMNKLGALVKDLEFNTKYCVRFRARRVSDDVVSEIWTNPA
jgi:hypothetical protein